MTPEIRQQAEMELEAEIALQAEIIADVRSRYPKVSFPDVYRSPLWYGRSGKIPIEDYHAIIGSIDGEEHVYANSVSKEYKIVTHEESLHLLENSLASIDNFGKPVIKSVLMHQNGAKMCARVEFPDCQLEIKDGKKVSPRVDNWNSYDLSKMYGLSWGAVEQVCTNGMVAYRVKSTISAKHRQNLDIGAEIHALTEGIAEFGGQIDEWQRWSKINLAPPKVDTIMEILPFGTRHTEKILALPQIGTGLTIEKWLTGGKVNLWDMNSIITQFLTHEIESELVRVKKGEEVAKILHQYATEN